MGKVPSFILCCLLSTNVYADPAFDYYEAALKLAEQQDFAASEIELRNSLQHDPDYLPARLLLGDILLAEGKAAAAESAYSTALKMNADSRTVVLKLAEARLMLYRHQQVRSLLLEHPELAEQADYHYFLGQTYQAESKTEQSRALYEKALELEPLRADILTAIAESLFDGNQLDPARQQVAAALKQQPDYYPALLLSAALHRLDRQPEKALSLYQQAADVQKDNEQAVLGEVMVLTELGNLSSALTRVLAFREQYPQNPYAKLLHSTIIAQQKDDRLARQLLVDVQHQLSGIDEQNKKIKEISFLSAVVDYANGHQDTAARGFKRFIREFGDNATAYRYLSMLALQDNDLESARSYVDQALAMSATDVQLYRLAASVYRALGETDKSLSLLETGRQKFPQDPLLQQQLLEALINENQLQSALQVLRAQQGEDLKSQVMLGFLQLQNGLSEQAWETTQKLLNQHPGKVEVLQLAGELSLRAAQIPEAIRFFRQAIELAPEFKAAWLGLAGIYLNQGKVAEVEKAYTSILAFAPEDVTTVKLYADLAISNQNTPLAVRLLESVTEKDNYDANRALLELYIQDSQLGKASALLKRMMQHSRLDPKLLLARARLEENEGKLNAAAETLKAVYGLLYDDARRLQTVAHRQIDIRDLEGAGHTLARVRKLLSNGQNPDDYLIARLALAKGDAEAALTLIDQVLQQQDGDPRMLELKAYALQASGASQQALDIFATLYARQPLRQHMQRLAQLYTALGQADAATDLLEGWLEKTPEDAWAVAQLSSMAARQGDIPGAISVLENYPQLNQNPLFLNNLAYYYIDTDLQKALEYASEASGQAPQVAAFNDTLGWIHTKLGQPAQGLKLLRQAHASDSRNADILYHLAYTLAELGQLAQARKMLLEAEQIAPESPLAKQVKFMLEE
ncbi:XrtA/PEP-CTERM system TPR-repeat protein PrsT [Lacimicrobium alkaliphilum]|uniref:PEP-CTERM system TPR-repeat protein PrsT n=1 Tax=Lacimicrobium alkaliphilum TaxID=1526571 RepID=A0ABQ1R160_9ALTE|nr:XrtA/PEP-CTERM system TPR-repeat protein PrsT [Lacimicrobium alkaliphilum]GGD51446.1 hypothetical protein GCM10011357_04190 [Lacimicrobium alkaliphilum]